MLWHQATPHSLRLLGVDSVVWRTPETAENAEAFYYRSNQHGNLSYPQARKQWKGLQDIIDLYGYRWEIELGYR